MADILLPSALLAAVAGALLSFLIEAKLQPRPSAPWRRPGAALAIHLVIWLTVFVAVSTAFRRPWFAAATVDALLVGLVLVNNAKMHSLREPFVFQDYEYFTDTLRHPRLYLPFFGIWRAALAAAAIGGAILAGLWLEPPVATVAGVRALVGMLAALAAIAVLLWVGQRWLPAARHEPLADLENLGLIASLWRYAQDERQAVTFPRQLAFIASGAAEDRAMPDLVAIQSESFFDPRRSFQCVNPGVLVQFDALKATGALHGTLQVDAWGANTVRTEFAFLSGIDPRALGVHRFNPYRCAARQRPPSIASYLKSLGYKTICLHPYPVSFYRRDLVYPALGFDEFIDLRGFAGAEREGPFVSDRAVAERICRLLETEGREQPLFLFAITMENHGPLHLEALRPGDVERLCSSTPPPGCTDLVIYLRHLANADLMIGKLRQCLERGERPAGLCFYGDHVPIMAEVYTALGSPDGTTDFLIWNKGDSPRLAAAAPRSLRAEQLSLLWLQQAGLMDRKHRDPGSVSILDA